MDKKHGIRFGKVTFGHNAEPEIQDQVLLVDVEFLSQGILLSYPDLLLRIYLLLKSTAKNLPKL